MFIHIYVCDSCMIQSYSPIHRDSQKKPAFWNSNAFCKYGLEYSKVVVEDFIQRKRVALGLKCNEVCACLCLGLFQARNAWGSCQFLVGERYPARP